MSVLSVCQWLQDQPTSIAIRESIFVYPVVESVHVLSLYLFLGLVVMMDLRFLGIGNRHVQVSEIQKHLFPWQMSGLVLITVSGLVLSYAEPLRFYGNIFFRIKLVLLVAAVANAMIFHVTTYRSVGEWDQARVPPFPAKLAGAVSLIVWAGVVACGRMIKYA